MFALTVNHVCFKCNRHWMSDIESAVTPTVCPLIRGGGSLQTTEDGQLQLATWCSAGPQVDRGA